MLYRDSGMRDFQLLTTLWRWSTRLDGFQGSLTDLFAIGVISSLPPSRLHEAGKNYTVSNKTQKKTHRITLSISTTKRDTAKSRRASFANFIHQKDAAITTRVVHECILNAILVYTVHHNLIVPATRAAYLPSYYSRALADLVHPLHLIYGLLFENLISQSPIVIPDMNLYSDPAFKLFFEYTELALLHADLLPNKHRLRSRK